MNYPSGSSRPSVLRPLRLAAMLSVTSALFVWPLRHTTDSHPQMTNRERWMDILRSNPLGRLYRLYRDLEDVGIDFAEFDLTQPPLALHERH